MGASRGGGARVNVRRRRAKGPGDAPGAAEVSGGGVGAARGDQGGGALAAEAGGGGAADDPHTRLPSQGEENSGGHETRSGARAEG